MSKNRTNRDEEILDQRAIISRQRIQQKKEARRRKTAKQLLLILSILLFTGMVVAFFVFLRPMLINDKKETETTTEATKQAEASTVMVATTQPEIVAYVIDGNKLYSTDSAGKKTPYHGWAEIDGKKYYGEQDGTLIKDKIVNQDDMRYYLDPEGAMAVNTLIIHEGYLYNVAADGNVTEAKGWIEKDGRKYYAEENGRTYLDQDAVINDQVYHFTAGGYIIDGKPTIDQYMGCSGLLKWMEDHYSDYYFKTPYRGIWENIETPEELIKPYGEYGEDSGMNCSGFVASLLKGAGGDLDKLSDMGLEAKYGDADSYLYLALRDLVKYEVFDSVEELLASGKAKKGDIIYLYPVKEDEEGGEDGEGEDSESTGETPDCHVGVFWGTSSSDNKLWSIDRGGCRTTEITMTSPIAKVYLLPIDGN